MQVLPRHINNGACPRCLIIIQRYPGFEPSMKAWFDSVQLAHPEAHISCAGRGQLDQEALFIRKATRAHYGESAHNFNCALDFFRLDPINPAIYDEIWFNDILSPLIPSWLKWYGLPGSTFYELPHVELRDFKNFAKMGRVKLVE